MKNMLTDAVIQQLELLPFHLESHEEWLEEVKNDLEWEGCECTEPEFLPDENQWEPGHMCKFCYNLASESDPIWNGNASELCVNQTDIEDDLPF
jgi:hypothetical protein